MTPCRSKRGVPLAKGDKIWFCFTDTQSTRFISAFDVPSKRGSASHISKVLKPESHEELSCRSCHFFVPLGKGDAAPFERQGVGSRGLAQFLNLSPNHLQHPSEILPNLIVSKSEKLDSEGLDVLLSPSILLLLARLKVAVPVNLDGEL